MKNTLKQKLRQASYCKTEHKQITKQQPPLYQFQNCQAFQQCSYDANFA